MTTETYRQLRNRQQEETNQFPLGFAFSNSQFKEMMEKWGLKETDTDKIYSIGMGGFVRKSDHKAFRELLDRHGRELKQAVEADETGEGFIYQMFLYELNNHEYGYTGDISDTLESLGYTEEMVKADKRLVHGLLKAMKDAE